jgi:hypothetical protein
MRGKMFRGANDPRIFLSLMESFHAMAYKLKALTTVSTIYFSLELGANGTSSARWNQTMFMALRT